MDQTVSTKRSGSTGDQFLLSTLTLPEKFECVKGGKTIDQNDETEGNSAIPTIWQCTLAGAIGGVVGDTSMHSLDTVKTRQQGDFQAQKYKGTLNAYKIIWREEGFFRGLYSGYGAALMGSLPSSGIFFFTYEGLKRIAIDQYHINQSVSYLCAGFLGDFVSSIFYVPSEVIKTRLQLQGRYNNPYSHTDYNYRGTFDAIRQIVKNEGWQTLLFGYKATLFRDLPFSALQFTFYENFRSWAFKLMGKSKNNDKLPTRYELLTGAAAGGLAGILTTPCDVVKTRIQTQNPSSGNFMLKSSSLLKNLAIIYRHEGIRGIFSGVGPRFVWTSVQSSIMLLLYQTGLRLLSSDKISFE